MRNWFDKLPGFKRSPPGLERTILHRLPRVLVLGTLVLALPSLFAHGFLDPENPGVRLLDIYAISLVILHGTIVLTVGIAALIVWVMKGPAYVADAYPLEDHDPPADEARR